MYCGGEGADAGSAPGGLGVGLGTVWPGAYTRRQVEGGRRPAISQKGRTSGAAWARASACSGVMASTAAAGAGRLDVGGRSTSAVTVMWRPEEEEESTAEDDDMGVG